MVLERKADVVARDAAADAQADADTAITDAAAAQATANAATTDGAGIDYTAVLADLNGVGVEVSATRPSFICVDVTITCDRTEHGRVTIQVERAAMDDTYQTVHQGELFNNDGNTLTTNVQLTNAPLTAFVPAGRRVRLTTQNLAGAPAYAIARRQAIIL